MESKFDKKLESFKKTVRHDTFFYNRLQWGYNVDATGIKLFLTIILFLPGLIMFLCGTASLLLGIVGKPFTELAKVIKRNMLKKRFPAQFSEYLKELENDKKQLDAWTKHQVQAV